MENAELHFEHEDEETLDDMLQKFYAQNDHPTDSEHLIEMQTVLESNVDPKAIKLATSDQRQQVRTYLFKVMEGHKDAFEPLLKYLKNLESKE